MDRDKFDIVVEDCSRYSPELEAYTVGVVINSSTFFTPSLTLEELSLMGKTIRRYCRKIKKHRR